MEASTEGVGWQGEEKKRNDDFRGGQHEKPTGRNLAEGGLLWELSSHIDILMHIT